MRASGGNLSRLQLSSEDGGLNRGISDGIEENFKCSLGTKIAVGEVLREQDGSKVC